MTLQPDSSLVDAVHPSPNHEPRRGYDQPDLLLLHYTGMKSSERAVDWLSRPESKVSCHYVIDESGRITQLVAESRRAWHAGVACWNGETDINSASIGIEIQNPGHDDGYPPFSAAQMAGVEALCRDIVARWNILPERVLAHSDVAPRRKIDPGEKFDWERLHAAGIGRWHPPAQIDATDLGWGAGTGLPIVATAQTALASYGYCIPVTGVLDRQTEYVVAAFQRHFRPARVDGRLDRSTLMTLNALVFGLDDTAVI